MPVGNFDYTYTTYGHNNNVYGYDCNFDPAEYKSTWGTHSQFSWAKITKPVDVTTLALAKNKLACGIGTEAVFINAPRFTITLTPEGTFKCYEGPKDLGEYLQSRLNDIGWGVPITATKVTTR